MSDNKKYYYIKVKDNYFEKDAIKILESQDNGYIYSLIILKLALKSARHEGCLMMTDRIAYSPDNVDILAKIINHDVSHVRDAIRAAKDLDLISIIGAEEIWMNDIQGMIGSSSTEADRKRKYRRKLKEREKTLQIGTNVHQSDKTNVPIIEEMGQTSTRVKRLEIRDKSIDKKEPLNPLASQSLFANYVPDKPKQKRFSKPTIEEITEYCKSRNNKVNPDQFINFYDSKGWKVGKNSMKDWKAAIRTWENNNFNTNENKTDNFQRGGINFEL